jgi:large subunit ribosomal protein L31
MKKDLHPNNYRVVVFQDINNGSTFITRSTAETEETIEVEGVTYPLVKVHISSASHPFFTGQEKLVDIEGRVDRFKARVEASKNKRASFTKKPKASASPKPAKTTPQKLADLKDTKG